MTLTELFCQQQEKRAEDRKRSAFSRTLKVLGGIISQANRYLGDFCSSQRTFPPHIIQVLLFYRRDPHVPTVDDRPKRRYAFYRRDPHVPTVDDRPKRYRPRIPRKTLSIWPMRRYPLMSDQRWRTASVGDQPVMQIVSEWQVTNLAKTAIHIHRARIMQPRKARTDGEVYMIDPHTNLADDVRLAPRSSAEVLTQFFVQPPVCQEGEDFKAKIVFTDQFGNKHKTKWIVFKYD